MFGFALTQHSRQRLAPESGLEWVVRDGRLHHRGICALCAVFLLAVPKLFRAGSAADPGGGDFPARGALPARSRHTLRAFSEGMESTRNHGFLALLVLYTVLEWVVIVAAYYGLFPGLRRHCVFWIARNADLRWLCGAGEHRPDPGDRGRRAGGDSSGADRDLRAVAGASSGLAMLIWVLELRDHRAVRAAVCLPRRD